MKKFTKLIILLILILSLSIVLFIPVLKNINFGIDLMGGFEILYRIEPLTKGKDITEEDKSKTYEAIVNRIDTLGVSEPVITFEGENILRIGLPGVKDEEGAKEVISTIGLLTFRDTSDNILMTSEILGTSGASVDTHPETLKSVVKLDIKDNKKFYEVTKSISESTDNRIVIWLDFEEGISSFLKEESTCGEEENSKCLSAAYVNEGLNSSNIVIEGNFTKDKVTRLASLINAGSLPAKLVEDSTPHSVSPTFGSSTIEKCGIAGIVTLLIISLILIIKYRFTGLISSISLIIYSILTFALFNGIGGVLTLPGIAALILGIGMAVDASIISIERIKDEYHLTKNLQKGFENGTKRSLSAIIDANITTVLIAIVLYIFGESTIKGFAIMLILSIVVTIISMVIIDRLLMKIFVKTKYFDNKTTSFFGKIKEKTKINFIKINKYALISFAVIFVSGIILYFVNGVNLGVDFSGGTSINMISENTINLEKVENTLKPYDISEIKYYASTNKEGYAKLNKILTEEEKSLVINDFNSMNIDTSINEISTMVTEKLTKNAIYSLLISFILIIIYVAIRFNFNFGVSGLVALIHDIVLIILLFIILKMQLNFIIVAALLTIIGYSINDTIVIFDRIRENKKMSKNEIKNIDDMKTLLNDSLNDIFTRNVLTTVTTVLAVMSLLVLNVNEIFTFNIAILIGLIGGCISSLLFAPSLWMLLEKRNIGKKKKVKNIDEIDELDIKGINS